MALLVRKVNPAKWRGSEWASRDRIPSDALTNCMKTTGNALSFWRVDGREDGEEEAILALLGTQDRIDKIDVVFIEDKVLKEVSFANTPGNTIFADLRNLHVDVADLDHSSFLNTASVLSDQIFGDNVKRVTKTEFKHRIQDALDKGRIAWESIPEAMRKELTKPQE